MILKFRFNQEHGSEYMNIFKTVQKLSEYESLTLDQIKALIAVTKYNKSDNSQENFATLNQILDEIELELTMDQKQLKNDYTERNFIGEIDTKITNESKVSTNQENCI